MQKKKERSENYKRASDAVNILTLREQVELAISLTFHLWLVAVEVEKFDEPFCEALDSLWSTYTYAKKKAEGWEPEPVVWTAEKLEEMKAFNRRIEDHIASQLAT